MTGAGAHAACRVRPASDRPDDGAAAPTVLTFADRSFYATYQRVPRVWGLSAIEDQQLAGLIMWIPGGLVYLVALLVWVGLVLREPATELRAAGGSDRRDPVGRAGNDAKGAAT